MAIILTCIIEVGILWDLTGTPSESNNLHPRLSVSTSKRSAVIHEVILYLHSSYFSRMTGPTLFSGSLCRWDLVR